MLKIVILFLLFTYATLQASTLSAQTPPLGYKLVWGDEFDGVALDESKWSHRYLGKRKLGYTTANSIVVASQQHSVSTNISGKFLDFIV